MAKFTERQHFQIAVTPETLLIENTMKSDRKHIWIVQHLNFFAQAQRSHSYMTSAFNPWLYF